MIRECFLFRSLLYLFSSQVHSKARLPFTWTSSLEWNKIAFESIHYANELQHDFSWNLFLEKCHDWIRLVANACQFFCEIQNCKCQFSVLPSSRGLSITRNLVGNLSFKCLHKNIAGFYRGQVYLAAKVFLNALPPLHAWKKKEV